MAFFDKIGEVVSTKSRDIAQKAKEMADISSLNGQISNQEEIINRMYLEIGKNYYEVNKNEAEALYNGQCAAITEAFDKISAIKKEIQVIKKIQICPNCGAEIPAGVSFCSGCGSKVEQEQPEPKIELSKETQPELVAAATKSCPGCGKELSEDNLFCTGCGQKLQ